LPKKIENDAYSQQIPEDFKELIKALENKEQNKCEQIMKDHAIHFINQIKMSLYAE